MKKYIYIKQSHIQRPTTICFVFNQYLFAREHQCRHPAIQHTHTHDADDIAVVVMFVVFLYLSISHFHLLLFFLCVCLAIVQRISIKHTKYLLVN